MIQTNIYILYIYSLGQLYNGQFYPESPESIPLILSVMANVWRLWGFKRRSVFHISYSSAACDTRADSKFSASQWETSLESNAVSHWLGANLESVIPWQACGITVNRLKDTRPCILLTYTCFFLHFSAPGGPVVIPTTPWPRDPLAPKARAFTPEQYDLTEKITGVVSRPKIWFYVNKQLLIRGFVFWPWSRKDIGQQEIQNRPWSAAWFYH